MNYLVLLACICIFVTLQHVNGKVFVKDGQFEIRDGNCSNAVAGDLVFQTHVHKLPIPFTVRDDTEEWHGDETIYCITALSQQPASVKSTITIGEGGVNHTFVTLKMVSKRGNGFEYNIQVFAKK